MTDRREQILACAERRMRTDGYNGFSFRDLAADVGVKSASIHHHFPAKADLGAAALRRYTDRFIEALSSQPPGKRRLVMCVEVFRRSLVEEGLVCLAGMLAAENKGVPSAVARETKNFFTQAANLLGEAPLDRSTSISTLATLEGAMLIANAMGDNSLFERTAERLLTRSDR